MTSILLTGSTRGIGAAAREALTAAGATVVGHGRAPAAATDASAGITLAEDLALAGAGDRLWDAALAALGGRIDVLVNNAGVFEAVAAGVPAEPPTAARADDAAHAAADAAWAATWERSWRINLQAAADLSRRAVAHFRDHPAGPDGVRGRIVTVASRAAFRGDSPDHWHYAAAKAGMVAMTRTIARAYAGDGVLAFVVAPGFTMTGMAEDYLASRGGDRLLADIPLGRVAGVGEVAETIRWLTLDAPPSLTGAVLDINGASYVR